MPHQMIRCLRQPSCISSMFLDDHGCKIFYAIGGRASEWFKQTTGNEHRNIVWTETEKPCSFFGVKSGW